MEMHASETITENLFRSYYWSSTFIEKSAIHENYGFTSKKNSGYKWYPDFMKELDDFVIVVEAKASDHWSAMDEIQHYMLKNKITKDVVWVAVSGQDEWSLMFDLFLKERGSVICKHMGGYSSFLPIDNISKLLWKNKYWEMVSSEQLTKTLKSLNKKFNDNNKVRDTDRSLFFSWIMIALKDNTFRNTYGSIQAPSKDEVGKMKVVLESINLNEAILEAITRQLENKINNISKQYSWKDKFSFIRNIDYSLMEYKKIINEIENNIFKPFQNDEKQDILGKAYKIFLSRSGKIDNKNIILTPDHIKSLMIKLARITLNDIVLDTCTWTWGFLMEAMEEMIWKSNNDESAIKRIKETQLIWFEIDPVLFALACSNMFLHGDGRTNLIYRSSLVNDSNEGIIDGNEDLLQYIKSLKPTKCIINPPYENNNPAKFTHQALDYLEDNWKLVIIMPTPTLTKNQNWLTEKILKKAKLDFVIKMPYNLFSEQKRSVNTSIFWFTKAPHDKNDDVLFYNLSDDWLVSVQHKGRIDKNNKWHHIKNNLLDLVQNSKEQLWICEKRKIYRDGVLNCAWVQNTDSRSAKMMKIEDLFILEKWGLASDDSEEGEYSFITWSEEWKTHSSYDYDKEAIVYVIGAAGSLWRTHYVNGKFTASNLSVVLTPKDPKIYPINLQFYDAYFQNNRTRIVSDLADWTSKLTIREGDFANYFIDYVPIDKQLEFVNAVVEPKVNKISELKKAIMELDKDINNKMGHLLKSPQVLSDGNS